MKGVSLLVKQLKRIASLMLSVSVLVIALLPITVNACNSGMSDNSESVSIYEISINEYSSILQSINEPEKLESFKKQYAEYIFALNELSDSELSMLRYNDKQIDAIRHFDGSEKLARAASAYISGSYYLGYYYYNPYTDKTYATVQGTVYWNGTPFIKGQDELGAGVKGSSANFAYYSSSCSISFPSGTVHSSNYHYYSMSGISYKFGIADVNTQIFNSATISYTGVAQGEVTVLDYGIGYAHYTVNWGMSANFGLNVSANGPSVGAGVSFSVSNGYELSFSSVSTYLS